MLNRSKNDGTGRGSDAEINKWMFDSAEYVLGKIKPKVFWGENAPGLFTNIGEGVVEGLRLVKVFIFQCEFFTSSKKIFNCFLMFQEAW